MEGSGTLNVKPYPVTFLSECFVSVLVEANDKRNCSGLCHLMWWGAAIFDSFRKDANCALIHASHHTFYLRHMSLKHACLIYSGKMDALQLLTLHFIVLWQPLVALVHTPAQLMPVYPEGYRGTVGIPSTLAFTVNCIDHFHWILPAASGQH